MNVKIPAGVSNGQQIELKGGGVRAEGKTADLMALWLVIHIAPHPLFDIVNQDLEVVLPLCPMGGGISALRCLCQRLRAYFADHSPGSRGWSAAAYQEKLASKKHTGVSMPSSNRYMPPSLSETAALAAADARCVALTHASNGGANG